MKSSVEHKYGGILAGRLLPLRITSIKCISWFPTVNLQNLTVICLVLHGWENSVNSQSITVVLISSSVVLMMCTYPVISTLSVLRSCFELHHPRWRVYFLKLPVRLRLCVLFWCVSSVLPRGLFRITSICKRVGIRDEWTAEMPLSNLTFSYTEPG